ncbi:MULTISPECIES: hypothetical protein [unclassified Thalassospira]|uniref:hypothetical protein n=1 Tax=unclassified Thalassospira TaxID=2648997 RepID=UPI0007A62EEE|nr:MULTISPECIES: hypothetical protein [unclassified Thalassospira]KZD00476.1 hypothetical protein AUQ41_07825 [Thalassospira sp. MCCC 1A02898]ONH87278.1 hypothetical protein TH47_11865 [Thalassospira sp. MCCC 1A02803]
MGFWSIRAAFVVASIFVDYLIAEFLSEHNSEFWLIFTVLLTAPVLFALKYALIKYVICTVFLNESATTKLLLKFERESWPYPLMNYRDGMDYLVDLTVDEDASPEVKVSAARLHGNLENQFQSMQLLSAFMSNKVLTKAVNAYREAHPSS